MLGSENGEADVEFHVACQHLRDGVAMMGVKLFILWFRTTDNNNTNEDLWDSLCHVALLQTLSHLILI